MFPGIFRILSDHLSTRSCYYCNQEADCVSETFSTRRHLRASSARVASALCPENAARRYDQAEFVEHAFRPGRDRLQVLLQGTSPIRLRPLLEMIFGIRIYTPDINESVVGDRFPVALLLKSCPDGNPDPRKYKRKIALSKIGFV